MPVRDSGASMSLAAIAEPKQHGTEDTEGGADKEADAGLPNEDPADHPGDDRRCKHESARLRSCFRIPIHGLRHGRSGVLAPAARMVNAAFTAPMRLFATLLS